MKVIARQRRSTVDSHKGWIGDIEETQGTKMNFPILADADRKVAKLYDMIHPEANDTLTVRSVFVIDPNKKIRADHHLPGLHGPQLRRDPARDRLAAAHRQPQGRHARQLEGRRRLRDRPVAEGPEVIAEKFPKGGGAALLAHDAAAEQ